MLKKVILGVVVIVVILGIGFAALNNPKTATSPTNNSSIQNVQNTNNTSVQTTGNKTISSEEAQKIASKYIEVNGAVAGTPTLVKQDNRLVYIVPIMENGKNVGEIDIDAETGENLGGAGGG